MLGNYLVSSKGNENVPTSNENVPITCNFKNWSEDIHLHLNCTKVQAAIDLIKHIAPTVEHYLDRRVDNLLVDSWYADNQNFVMEVNSLGYKTIGLIRLSDTKYVTRKGDTVTTKSLANELKADESAQSTNDIVATYQLRRSNPTAAQKNKAKSLGQTNFVQSFKGNFVNVSFCKNKTPSSSRPLLPLMDTNLERKPETSKSIYGKRWAIESIYKVV